MIASHFVETLDQFVYEGESNPQAFVLLQAALGWLCEDDADLQLAARYYEFRLLRVMGYEPSLFECVVSGETLTAEDQFFSVAEGGVVLPAYTVGHRCDAAVAARLQNSDGTSAATPGRPVREPTGRMRGRPEELESLLHKYLTYLLERRLNSVQMLDKAGSRTSPTP